MPQIPNKLMPALQFIAALVLIALFCLLAAGPMFHLSPADDDMKATLKDIMLILTGFLFGSAVSSAKKDDQNALLAAQLLPAPPSPPPAAPAGAAQTPAPAAPPTP